LTSHPATRGAAWKFVPIARNLKPRLERWLSRYRDEHRGDDHEQDGIQFGPNRSVGKTVDVFMAGDFGIVSTLRLE
jgi:hypothetical protein